MEKPHTFNERDIVFGPNQRFNATLIFQESGVYIHAILPKMQELDVMVLSLQDVLAHNNLVMMHPETEVLNEYQIYVSDDAFVFNRVHFQFYAKATAAI